MRERTNPEEETLRLVFVCTANISRSPYAQRRAAHFMPTSSTIEFASAGVPGFPGEVMDPAMARELEARGGRAQGHVSRSLTTPILEHSHVVVTLEFAHRLRICEQWPEQAAKVVGLRQLADALARADLAHGGGLRALDAALTVAQADSLAFDVADPYRRGRRAARACADEIDAALAVIVPALVGAPSVPAAGGVRSPGRRWGFS